MEIKNGDTEIPPHTIVNSIHNRNRTHEANYLQNEYRKLF